MNTRIERTLRFIGPDEHAPRPTDHWSGRSTAERLHATLALHHEGNALFKGGAAPFTYQWALRHVPARQ